MQAYNWLKFLFDGHIKSIHIFDFFEKSESFTLIFSLVVVLLDRFFKSIIIFFVKLVDALEALWCKRLPIVISLREEKDIFLSQLTICIYLKLRLRKVLILKLNSISIERQSHCLASHESLKFPHSPNSLPVTLYFIWVNFATAHRMRNPLFSLLPHICKVLQITPVFL